MTKPIKTCEYLISETTVNAAFLITDIFGVFCSVESYVNFQDVSLTEKLEKVCDFSSTFNLIIWLMLLISTGTLVIPVVLVLDMSFFCII